jgi:DNA-binding NarL/FixJ family response regulator
MPHEIRLLTPLVEGHNFKTAAVEVGVALSIIASYMRGIYEKLHVHSKSEALAKALRNWVI